MMDTSTPGHRRPAVIIGSARGRLFELFNFLHAQGIRRGQDVMPWMVPFLVQCTHQIYHLRGVSSGAKHNHRFRGVVSAPRLRTRLVLQHEQVEYSGGDGEATPQQGDRKQDNNRAGRHLFVYIWTDLTIS